VKTSLIITSISEPNKILREFAKGCALNHWDYIVIGDAKSPKHFNIDGCNYFSLKEQQKLSFQLAKNLPANHYSRKNLGYLTAMQNGSKIIVESDDDNLPLKSFWNKRTEKIDCLTVQNTAWTNVFNYFSKKHVWPRGFPLEEALRAAPPFNTLQKNKKSCPIQQGLANNQPDVDAIYRLTTNTPIKFQSEKKHIALGKKSWCPFNSQNTTWFYNAFPLLYLPSHCSFRMTDIWRSFVAQRVGWENGWHLDFHQPTVVHKRNRHNLLKDFSDEIPGYLHNSAICLKLEKLNLKGGKQNIQDDMLTCYKEFIAMKLIEKTELKLLDAWCYDISKLL
jgi:hypothetical protein